MKRKSSGFTPPDCYMRRWSCDNLPHPKKLARLEITLTAMDSTESQKQKIAKTMAAYFKARSRLHSSFAELNQNLEKNYFSPRYLSRVFPPEDTLEQAVEVTIENGFAHVTTTGPWRRECRYQYELLSLENSWKIDRISYECFRCKKRDKA